MGNLRQFVFGTREGQRGETLPLTRWDILLSVILGIALVIAIAYSAEPHGGGWSIKRGLLVGVTAIFTMGAAQNRRVVLGCAFSLIVLRMGLAVFTGPHPLAFLAGALAAGCAAWLLLHDLK